MGILGHCRLGDFELWALNAGRFRLDGGAMFGVVPRPLWEKRIRPDGRNRIELSMTCLLVRTPEETVLVETGFGGKVTETQRDIFALDESEHLVGSLAEAGIEPGQVDRVILTHLHQDHAGGATVQTGDGYAPTFANARYFVQRQEWLDAVTADAQTAGGFRVEEVMHPLEQAGVMEFLAGETEICPGIRAIPTPGHTRGHQSVLVESGGETACFIGDLVPTSHHLKPIYLMAFDLYPRETFEHKQDILNRAAEGRWLTVWPHDPEMAWGYIRTDHKGVFVAVEE